MATKTTIYFDIHNLYATGLNTGIQRVVKEFLVRLIDDKSKKFFIKIGYFNSKTHKLIVLSETDIRQFLLGQRLQEDCEIVDSINFADITKDDIFFDIDSTWNNPLKRAYLYPQLKKNEVRIFNYIYDLAPIVHPYYAHPNSLRNYVTFLSAVYSYSDLVFFSSRSSERDFNSIGEKIGTGRTIPTVVTKLGSDFFGSKDSTKSKQPLSRSTRKALKSKFILFVGTLEPRKGQSLALSAFEKLSKEQKDLSMVFIGKQGWLVEELADKIDKHKLLNKRLFWFDDVDDHLLIEFYKNAHIVVYLSEYEGFGLPIAESLSYGNITITSKNSSMYEVGKDYADYLLFNTENELVETVSTYLEDPVLYKKKREFIKDYYRPYSWDGVYKVLASILNNTNKVKEIKNTLAKKQRSKMQFIFISIDKHNIQKTIASIDKRINFVKEYLVITSPDRVDDFEKIKTHTKLKIIDEEQILGKYKKIFKTAKHQKKNWLLRSRLAESKMVDEEFIMLDDDNRPLSTVDIRFFKTNDNRYSAYYYYDLLDWVYNVTNYDRGQYYTARTLDDKGYELLSYSSHAPQIINKSIYKEVVDEFLDTGMKVPIDEWSSYFNYAITKYPSLFDKQVFKTMSWPARPTDWDTEYNPPEFVFENYYKHLYEDGVFSTLKDQDNSKAKIMLKEEQMAPYNRTARLSAESKELASENEMVHGIMAFSYSNGAVYLSSTPYIIGAQKDTVVRIRLNYKHLINKKKTKADVLKLCYTIIEYSDYETELKPHKIFMDDYDEKVISLPIIAKKPGVYEVIFDISVNDTKLLEGASPYRSKLVVCDEGESLEDALLNNRKNNK